VKDLGEIAPQLGAFSLRMDWDDTTAHGKAFGGPVLYIAMNMHLNGRYCSKSLTIELKVLKTESVCV